MFLKPVIALLMLTAACLGATQPAQAFPPSKVRALLDGLKSEETDRRISSLSTLQKNPVAVIPALNGAGMEELASGLRSNLMQPGPARHQAYEITAELSCPLSGIYPVPRGFRHTAWVIRRFIQNMAELLRDFAVQNPVTAREMLSHKTTEVAAGALVSLYAAEPANRISLIEAHLASDRPQLRAVAMKLGSDDAQFISDQSRRNKLALILIDPDPITQESALWHLNADCMLGTAALLEAQFAKGSVQSRSAIASWFAAEDWRRLETDQRPDAVIGRKVLRQAAEDVSPAVRGSALAMLSWSFTFGDIQFWSNALNDEDLSVAQLAVTPLGRRFGNKGRATLWEKQKTAGSDLKKHILDYLDRLGWKPPKQQL